MHAISENLGLLSQSTPKSSMRDFNTQEDKNIQPISLDDTNTTGPSPEKDTPDHYAELHSTTSRSLGDHSILNSTEISSMNYFKSRTIDAMKKTLQNLDFGFLETKKISVEDVLKHFAMYFNKQAVSYNKNNNQQLLSFKILIEMIKDSEANAGNGQLGGRPGKLDYVTWGKPSLKYDEFVDLDYSKLKPAQKETTFSLSLLNFNGEREPTAKRQSQLPEIFEHFDLVPELFIKAISLALHVYRTKILQAKVHKIS